MLRHAVRHPGQQAWAVCEEARLLPENAAEVSPFLILTIYREEVYT